MGFMRTYRQHAARLRQGAVVSAPGATAARRPAPSAGASGLSAAVRCRRRFPARLACTLATVLLLAVAAVAAVPFAHLASAQAHAAIEISSAAELADMAEAVNKGGTEEYPANGDYVLTADIDLSGYESWTPIGKAATYSATGNPFRGTFDGAGHTIYNLTIVDFKGVSGAYGCITGLFGTVSDATIKNLSLQNVDISGTSADGTDLMSGALVGLARTSVIDSCSVSNVSIVDKASDLRTKTNNYAIGGIVGDLFAGSGDDGKQNAVRNCSVAACSISAGALYPDYPANGATAYQPFAGGVVGRVRAHTTTSIGTVEHCTFQGDIKANGFTGPFIAGVRQTSNKASDISKLAMTQSPNCYYAGTFALTDGDGSPVAESYNCGAGVWNQDRTAYQGGTALTDETRPAAQDALNAAETGEQAGLPWRIAVCDDASQLLVLDFRRASILPAYQKQNGSAFLTCIYLGCFGSADTRGVSLQWSSAPADDPDAPGQEGSASGDAFTLPIAGYGQTVTLAATFAGMGAARTSTCAVAAQETVWTVAKTTDPAHPSHVATMTASLANPAESGFAEDGFTFQWYGVTEGEGGSRQESPLSGPSAATRTLVEADFEGYTLFMVKATCKTADAFTISLDAGSTAGKIVYVKWDGGSDSNDGMTPAAPVQRLQRAYELLDSEEQGGSRNNNIVVVMDEYRDLSYGTDARDTFTKPATVTSYYAGTDTAVTLDGRETVHEDYQSEGACLHWYAATGDSSAAYQKLLYADTTFRNITFKGTGQTSNNNLGYIYCQGNSLTMDVGVRMLDYRRSSNAVGSYGLLSGSQSYDFHVVGGYPNYDEPVGTPLDQKTCEIVIKSGSYARIIAGGRNFASSGSAVGKQSHNQFGTEDAPFNVSITVDIDAGESQMSSSSGTYYKSDFTCDIGQVCGGQTDGTIYANSSITINNGVVPMVLGSSIGYARSVGTDASGNAYPNNDFVGTCKVTMNGGEVAQLYGGCLGRSSDASLPADSRFRSFKNKADADPDILVAINGGSLHKISKISASVIGVFACGAGGPTGVGNAAAGTVENAVSVQLDITGGTIGSAQNNAQLYGGGYGQSTGVSSAACANIEAGNLYGNVSVRISGGAVYGNVYGGGAGTAAYLSGNENTNALAQVVGTVSLSITGVTINGSVYGGGKGIVSNGRHCPDMAKVSKSVELVLSNATVTENVYGASAFGQVAGTATTTVTNSQIGGSVYGGGEGQALAAGATADDQSRVGYVGGSSTLSIEGGVVSGSVYGGGSLGFMAGTATTSVKNVEVRGSVFGAGRGDVLSAEDAGLQRVAGYVAQDATTTLQDATVAGSVYGGGSVGAVGGGTVVSVSGGTVGGSVFGAGRGQQVDEAALDVQRTVGQVLGNVTLTLAENAQVTGSVYGAGELGVTGDGLLTSGANPYTVSTPSDVTVIVKHASIGGSLFGGGQGNASAGGQGPRILGAVFGASQVFLYQGSVGNDLFGGGDQSFTYAPLDQGGTPGQATKVVVNGGASIYLGADGSVASASGSGTVTADEVPSGLAERREINLGGSVFGGGNIASVNIVRANDITVYGGTELFIKGETVDFTNSQKGGVYGDGNLSTAKGDRLITLIDLHSPASSADARKSFFSLQRANRVVASNCNINLYGARDLVSESDTTLYSVNRIDSLKLYNGTTLEFDTVVNGLGGLWSDVLTDRVFTSGDLTSFGDTVTDAEKESYRRFCAGQASSWVSGTGASQQTHTSANGIVVNNGKWLDVKQAGVSEGAYPYGTVSGLFSLSSNTAADGGAFVFGAYQGASADCTGTFISLNKDGNDGTDAYLDLYTESVTDVSGTLCRTWYIKAETYSYDRTVKAYTKGGNDASIQVLLPVTASSANQLLLDGIVIADQGPSALKDLRESEADAKESGGYYFDATFGAGQGASAIPLYNGYEDAEWRHDYASTETLVPVTFTLHLAYAGENLDEQGGTVSFTVRSTNGETYCFTLRLVIEEAYATAAETSHYGRVYESIAVENPLPVTTTSSFTAQYTTTYCPGAYKGLAASLSTVYTEAVHNRTGASAFPAGTLITMVDVTSPGTPHSYSYRCDGVQTSIPLTSFASLENAGTHYADPTGNTVITESLLFIVDYSGVPGGMQQGTMHMALNHSYGSNPNADILRYDRTLRNDQGDVIGTESSYNTLTTDYSISGEDAGYLQAQVQAPAGSGQVVETSHTQNFMYDTYTTQIRVSTPADYSSTAYYENEVALRLHLTGTAVDGSSEDLTLPAGSLITVTSPSGALARTRYYADAEGRSFVAANLGTCPNGVFTVEVRVSRYLQDGSLYAAGAQGAKLAQQGFALQASLFLSADGLYAGADPAGGVASCIATFAAARHLSAEEPVYEFDTTAADALLGVVDGKVVSVEPSLDIAGSASVKKGVLYCTKKTESDVEATVMRSAADGTGIAVDITQAGGSVKKAVSTTGKITFSIADAPASGSYLYEIRLGNTVYRQTVTVP